MARSAGLRCSAGRASTSSSHPRWVSDGPLRGSTGSIASNTSTAARVVLVTNEVGSGIVPATASGRYLRDLLGSLNARLGDHADEVRLVVAGRTLRIS